MKKQFISCAACLLIVAVLLCGCGETPSQNPSQADSAPQTQGVKPGATDPATQTQEETPAATPSGESLPATKPEVTQEPSTEAPVQIPDALVGTWKRFGSKEILDEKGTNIQEFTVTKDGNLIINGNTYLLDGNVNLASESVSFKGTDGIYYMVSVFDKYDGTTIKGGVELFSSVFSVEGNYLYYKEGTEEYLQKKEAFERRQYFSGVWYRYCYRNHISEDMPWIMAMEPDAPYRIEWVLGPAEFGGSVMSLQLAEKDLVINGYQVAYRTETNSPSEVPMFALCLLDDAPAPNCMGLLSNGEGPAVYRKAASNEERFSVELSLENWKDYLKPTIELNYAPQVDSWGDVTNALTYMKIGIAPVDTIWGVETSNGNVKFEYKPVSWGIFRCDKTTGKWSVNRLGEDELAECRGRLQESVQVLAPDYTGETDMALYSDGSGFSWASLIPLKEAEAPNEGGANYYEYLVICEVELNVTRIKGTISFYKE